MSRNGEVFAFYSLHSYMLAEDAATERLFESVPITVAASLLVSLLLAGLFAFFYSKVLSKDLRAIARGIDVLARGDLAVHIDEGKTREVSLIARSVNILRDKLNKERELRDQWAGDVAHDLRTPVAALKAQLEGMRDGVLDLTVGRIERNLGELNTIERLMNDLNELTKLESPEMKPYREPIAACGFVEGIVAGFESAAAEKGIPITVDCGVETLFADAMLLNRAVSNVLGNAVRFTNRNGRITVRVYAENGFDVIEIFNTGSYIPEGERTKIFDRLYRGESARNSAGTGLGLTIALKIVELHGGAIAVTGTHDTGTTFVLKIRNAAPGELNRPL